MKKFLIYIITLLILYGLNAYSKTLSTNTSNDFELQNITDQYLRHRIKYFGIQPLKTQTLDPNRSKIELGRRLFSEKNISGNRRIACITCHNPISGTSDAKPMSQTENGKGILKRNATALFNIGADNKRFMFWDGRVSYDFKKQIFETPEISLNGLNPKASNITNVMTSAVAAQALFPMVTAEEMSGLKGENEIANSKDRLEAWSKIVSRLKSMGNLYLNLFSEAYPDTPLSEINIGHVAEAIAAFEREEFQSSGSPFQQYLNGDNNALTLNQKKGFMLFMGKGKCINCHQGSELGNNNVFAANSTPQWGEAPFVADKGRALVVNQPERNFFFKVPGLLNISLTAPYMHNGAFENLSEVINHYNHLNVSLNLFDVTNERQNTIPVKVEIDNNPKHLDDFWLASQSGLNPTIPNQLFLLPSDKFYLRAFLKDALTDLKWVKQ